MGSYYRYAAYGSNLHPVRLAARTPSARLLGTDFLEGWSLHFHKRSDRDGSAKCSMHRRGEGVYVAVYEIAESEKTMLDDIEGLGVGYDEISIELPKYGLCQSFTARPSHIADELAPFDWYREMVLLGCEVHAFPHEYRAGISSIDALVDNDVSRSRAAWQTVRRLRNGSGQIAAAAD